MYPLMQAYRGMAWVQTNQMEATPAIYVPAIFNYNSHLIGFRPRHTPVKRLTSVSKARLEAVHARACYFQYS